MRKSLLLVLDKPTFNTSSQSTVSVVEGRSLSVVCNTISNPNAQFRWNTTSGQIVSGYRTLVFQAINRSDAKTYICITRNSAGLDQRSSLKVVVHCKWNCCTIVDDII